MLFSKVGIFGRVLCVLFFLCLLVAGLSSLLPNIQVVVITLKELGGELLSIFPHLLSYSDYLTDPHKMLTPIRGMGKA